MKKTFFFAILVFSLAIIGCTKTTDIGDIQKDVSKFNGKEVTIEGKVITTANVLIVKYYELKDKTGRIIVTTDGELPKKGDDLEVSGKVNQFFNLGSTKLSVVEEVKRN